MSTIPPEVSTGIPVSTLSPDELYKLFDGDDIGVEFVPLVEFMSDGQLIGHAVFYRGQTSKRVFLKKPMTLNSWRNFLRRNRRFRPLDKIFMAACETKAIGHGGSDFYSWIMSRPQVAVSMAPIGQPPDKPVLEIQMTKKPATTPKPKF